jgi:hypothetical protein
MRSDDRGPPVERGPPSVVAPLEVFIVRLRGLPWTVSISDVYDFFSGIGVVDNSVVVCLSEQGRPTGMSKSSLVACGIIVCVFFCVASFFFFFVVLIVSMCTKTFFVFVLLLLWRLAPGEAFIQLLTRHDLDQAMLRDHDRIGSRYIELYVATWQEYMLAVKRCKPAMGVTIHLINEVRIFPTFFLQQSHM